MYAVTTKSNTIAFAVTMLLGSISAGAQTEPQQLPQATETTPSSELTQLEQDAAGTETLALDNNANQQGRQAVNSLGTGAAAMGNGIALSENGQARLHLAVDMAAGFDINPYSIPVSRLLSDFAGDVVARIRPRAQLNYPGSLISFNGNAYIDYGFLPGVITGKTRNFALLRSGVGGGIEVNRGGTLSFALRDQLTFTNEPGYITNGSEFTSFNNNLQAGLGYVPGGGTLRFRFTGTFGIRKFIEWVRPAGLDVTEVFGGRWRGPIVGIGTTYRTDLLDTMNFGAKARVDWRFLPKTGLFAEVSTGVHFYPFVDPTTNTLTPVSFPTRFIGGIMGQITPRLSGMASVGYTNPFTTNFTDPYSNKLIPVLDSLSFLGLSTALELRWRPTNGTNLTGGFYRRVDPVPLYQHLTNNRLYLNFEQWLGRDLMFRAFGGYSVMNFGRDLSGISDVEQTFLAFISQGSRLDGHLDFQLAVTYYLFDWMSVGISNDLDFRLTNTTVRLDTAEDLNLSFVRNQTVGLLSFHY